MIRRPIRNLASNKPVPTRLFDLLIDEEHPERIFIEQKVDKKTTERVPWEEVKHQVESAINELKTAI